MFIMNKNVIIFPSFLDMYAQTNYVKDYFITNVDTFHMKPFPFFSSEKAKASWGGTSWVPRCSRTSAWSSLSAIPLWYKVPLDAVDSKKIYLCFFLGNSPHQLWNSLTIKWTLWYFSFWLWQTSVCNTHQKLYVRRV